MRFLLVIAVALAVPSGAFGPIGADAADWKGSFDASYRAATTDDAAFTANLYLSPSAGSSSCVRSNTPKTYSEAAAAGNVCSSWTVACARATAGDTVGVKAGRYSSELASQSTLALFQDDCSDGLASDVDPTQVAAGTNPAGVSEVTDRWVEFACADGEAGASAAGPSASSVYDDFGDFTPHGNNHMWIHGGCFTFSSVLFGRGGDGSLTTQNVILDGVQMQAFELKGARNVWVNDSQLGPFVYCAASGAARCMPSGSPVGWFEERWAGRGDSDKNGQGQIGPNAGRVNPENVLFSNFWDHDSQTRNSASWHTGCLILLDISGAPPSDNVILRNLKCERVAVQGIYLSGSSGVTVENAQVACPTYPLVDSSNPSGLWALCASGQRSVLTSDQGTNSNVLVRFSSFKTAAYLGSNASIVANVRAVGNIVGSWQACPSDLVASFNVQLGGAACGSNTSAQAGTPWVEADAGTVYTGGSRLNMHLAAGPFGWENAVSPTGPDYSLTVDMDNAVRTPGARTAGADERGPGTPPPPKCPGENGGLTLTKLSETATTITLAWQPVAGATGYRFSRSDQAKRSHTWDAGRSTVRFGKIPGGGCYRVEALGVIAEGGADG